MDLGRTWLRVAAFPEDSSILRLRRRACPVEAAPRVLRQIWRRQGWSPSRVTGLVVAARGVWTRRERRDLARRLRSLAWRVRVLSDAQAAFLGALGRGPGVLVLAGTGSIVVGRDARGRWARAGGLGPLLGDEGSAFWLGREWLRATTRGEDVEPARRLLRSADPVTRVAALAPRVVQRARAGDPRARAIVRVAQTHLAAQVRAVVTRLRLAPPVAVSWAGSVLANEWVRAGLRRALVRAGLRVQWRPPREEPVQAAARLALGLARARRIGPRNRIAPSPCALSRGRQGPVPARAGTCSSSRNEPPG